MRKEELNIVIVGHVDHGKSTLIGRLLLDTNSLSKEKLLELRNISKELGKEAELAFLIDHLKEEREQERTIDTAQTFFKTPYRRYVIIDAPGHAEFIQNMLTGASLAHAAVLLIDAHEGLMEQTRRHLYLVNMLGIENIIVAFNKMDLLNYGEEKFNVLKAEILNFFDKLNIKPQFIIPISARAGTNTLSKSALMSWYSGPSLLQALDLIKTKVKKATPSLRFPVQDVYSHTSKRIVVGRIESGTIKKGKKLTVLPSGLSVAVKDIVCFNRLFKVNAIRGENIGLALHEDGFIKRGDVLVDLEDSLKPTEHFKANIFWTSSKPLEKNSEITLRCTTQEVNAEVLTITQRMNSSTLDIVEADSQQLEMNEAAIITFKTRSPIVIENVNDSEAMGRLIIERNHALQGVGIITQSF